MTKSTVIWVANRNKPLREFSRIVTIAEDGNLVVLNVQKQVTWSTNVSNIRSHSVVQLLDSGNLVLRDNATGVLLWESFQHPSNTILPNMKLGYNTQSGEKIKLTSWKTPSDPSIGSFSGSLEPRKVAEGYIWKDNHPFWRSGPWNGRVFNGIPSMNNVYLSGFNVERLNLLVGTTRRNNGKACGSCDSRIKPICSCLRGFEPRNADEWNRQNWTSGCVRRKEMQCEKVKKGGEAGKGDGFLLLEKTKVPDFLEWSSIQSRDCKTQCLENCSCIAYAFDNGIGCMLWSRHLIDIQRFSSGGFDLYVRVAHSELDEEKNISVIVTITVITGTIIIAACAFGLWKWSSKQRGEVADTESMIGDLKELPLFGFEMLANATKNFHPDNKLGRGGFGPVYKGTLPEGQEVAIKRLSRASGQGLDEFMTEVVVISKLQHRNLVRLFGCCVEEGEKMLIYEYMPNFWMHISLIHSIGIFLIGQSAFI